MIYILYTDSKIPAKDNGTPIDPPIYWTPEILEGIAQAFADGHWEPVPEPTPPPPEPDWDALRLGLIASTTITNWFESVPALLQNDMAAQIQTQQLDKLLQGLSLTDYSAVKDELNQLLASCNFDLVLT